MFDTEIRGQMAMLMGGRAAEELTCSQVRGPHSGKLLPAGLLSNSCSCMLGSKAEPDSKA